MTTTPAYQPGDIANGYVLQSDCTWVPLQPNLRKPSSPLMTKWNGLSKVAKLCIAGGCALILLFVLIIVTTRDKVDGNACQIRPGLNGYGRLGSTETPFKVPKGLLPLS